VLPVPLYARVVDLDVRPPPRVVTRRGDATLIVTSAASDVEYDIALDEPPSFESAPPGSAPVPPGPSFMEPTADDDDLPAEVLAFVDELSAAGATLSRALAIRDFVRASYRYDATYLEDPAVARWLKSVSEGHRNVRIAALHAGRDARHLGRGVCYELNVLACELLRRAGIPAAIATGWTFSGGQIADPDHLWAMALLPTSAGPRWFPIDASTTRSGRPLRAGRRPPGPWRVRGAVLPQLPTLLGLERGAERGIAHAPRSTHKRRHAPVAELVRLVRHLERVSGEAAADAALWERCKAVLGDESRAKRLFTQIKQLLR